MEKYFLSHDNIDKLSRYLEKMITVKNTAESKEKFKKFVYTQMNNIFKKFGNKKPKNVPTSIFIEKLNNKVIETCVKIYEEKTGKRTSTSQFDMQMQRQRDVSNPKTHNRASSSSKTNSGFPGMLSSSGGSQYAPIISEPENTSLPQAKWGEK